MVATSELDFLDPAYLCEWKFQVRIAAITGISLALVLASASLVGAATIDSLSRQGFKDLVNTLVQGDQNFDAVGVPCDLPVKCISGPVTSLDVFKPDANDLLPDQIVNTVTLSTEAPSAGVPVPLVLTNARNASSGLQSLASILGDDKRNLAADQTVTFNFASAIVAFAIDINTFLQRNSVGEAGDFIATVFDDKGNPIGQATSQYSPFASNSNPNNSQAVADGKIGQFLGFSSGTPFNRVTISQLNPDSLQPYSLDTLIIGNEPEPDPPPPPPPPSPIPLPLPLALLLSGIVLLALMRRRDHA
jgi:MYXO-CTERM domain-containing protein